MIVKNTSLLHKGAVVSDLNLSFLTVNGSEPQTEFLILKGITHSSTVETVEIQTSAVLTGATKFGIAIYNQAGEKILNNLLPVEENVPSTANVVQSAGLSKHWMLTLANILNQGSPQTGSQLDLVLFFDAAPTNTSDVGITVAVRSHTTQRSIVMGTGQTVTGDQVTAATN